MAAQIQLNRSQSMHNQPTPSSSIPTKQPAQRSLSDLSMYYSKEQGSMPATRSPPGLNNTSVNKCYGQSSSLILAKLPQTPCVSLQRRESITKSEDGIQTLESASRYKTEMCRPFEETGHCRYGSKCQFAHGNRELRGLNRHPRYKTEFCRTFHTTGFCTYGQRCNFIHNEDERRIPPPSSTTTASYRQQTLQTNEHLPLTVSNSSGSSPASSVYGGDVSPTHSPNYLLEDALTASCNSRLSPAPSLSSFTSDVSCNSTSFPSPPSTPLHFNDFLLDSKALSSPIDLGLSIYFNSLKLRE